MGSVEWELIGRRIKDRRIFGSAGSALNSDDADEIKKYVNYKVGE